MGRPARLLVGLLSLMAACSGGGPATVPTPVSLLPISADQLKQDLYAFAADSMGGRETGTLYANKAARFLVSRLQLMGLEPAGDSMYYQRVPLIKGIYGPETRFGVAQGQSTVPLGLGADVAPLLSLGEGQPLPKWNADGDIVFAGYGMSAPDFAPINGQAGKIIVMLQAAPPSVTDSAERVKLEGVEGLSQRIVNSLQFRPAAIVLLMTEATRTMYMQQLPEMLRPVSLPPGDQSLSDSQRPLPMILLGLAKPNSPLLPNNWPQEAAPQLLAGKRFSAHIDVKYQRITGYNVVAVARGTDPRLNKTYVAFGAHYDHVGFQTGMAPDSIANGADDDGSGSVTLLAIAKSIAATRPKRSALFVWHVGEEKGLLGSKHFTDHPTVPIDSIVAQLNADMIGRRAGRTEQFDETAHPEAMNTLYVVGPDAAPNGQSKVLGAILDTVNARQMKPLTISHEWDTQTDPERIYYRSDHYNYARKGIPIVFFTTGLHRDYHRVSDEPNKIDYEKMARIGSLILELGTAVGNREARPR